jgi:C-terminal processing protease CtpA/Prc
MGVDIEGNPFPDLPGSTLEEKFWLRSWTNETYLWNDEVVDRDPASVAGRLEYFELLRTEELTPSGKPKDDFHFSQPTDEFLEQRNSAPQATYGARFVAFSTTPPRDFRVQYTEPNSPATMEVGGVANFIRGARILEVDGVDLVNANSNSEIDMLNAGLFPSTAGETHTFEVQDPGAASSRTVTVTSVDLARKPVNRMTTIDTPAGKVGYIFLTTFSPFSTEQELADAIAALNAEGVTDLVLDLRYNGGGLLAIAAQLGYMVAGDARTNGRVFEDLRFNDDAGGVNPVTGATNNAIPFYNTGVGFTVPTGTPLQTLNLPRVFVLSTESTCSASESVVNALRGIDVEVILIGDRTCGKPFGFYPQDNCGETYFTIQFQGVNDKGFGDYADGFLPDNASATFGVRNPGCAVADDLGTVLGDPAEPLLAAALQFRENGTCPAPPPTSTKVVVNVNAKAGKTAGAPTSAPVSVAGDVFETNRDMTLPGQDAGR